MKNSLKLTFLLLCTFSLLFTWNTQAQTQNSAIHVTSLEEAHDHNHTPGRNCHAHINLQNQIQADPSLEQRMQQIEAMTQQYVREHRGSYGRNTINIPVYVHVLYRTSQENISDAQIQSQMDQLNADFAATNSDIGKIPTIFDGVAAGNTGIQFTLVATTRKSTTKTSWGTRDDMKKSSRGGVDPITPETHLNMWVCNIGGGILGYAQFPGGSSATDGVVMGPQYFGSRNYGNNLYLSAPFDEGRTTTHEVGHYLNLRHIWGDGGCSVDDFVGDTPVAGGPNYGCPSTTANSCSGGLRDMHMNYMDYSNDACMYMFSTGQKDRMLACLATTRSQLGSGGSGGGGGGGNNCYTTVELTLTTKKKTAGISWTVEDANTGAVVASNGAIAPRTTTTTTLNLPAGDYVLNINACCGSSYSLSGDGQAVSGTSFCIGASARNAATTTTIVEEVAEQDVQLYPNPANSTINVDLGDITTSYTGRIVDATGRTVWVGELEAGANAINISALSTGLYYVAVVKADGEVVTKKFVKQ